MNICPLCDREMTKVSISGHHLIPKCKGGKEVIPIHKICHRKIHATFTEKELERTYNTIAKLRQHEEIIKFRKWLRNKDPDFYVGSDNKRK